jgi:hypothetical protein
MDASEYSAIYTDGPQDGDRVASAAVFGQQVDSLRLPSASSIFSPEVNAILLALNKGNNKITELRSSNLCENNMFTNSNKTFISFNYFSNERIAEILLKLA